MCNIMVLISNQKKNVNIQECGMLAQTDLDFKISGQSTTVMILFIEEIPLSYFVKDL